MKLIKKLDSYTIVSNEIFKHGLSFKAIGLYNYLVSKPDGWEYSISGIASQSGDGKDSIRTGLQELEEMGFLRREQVRDGGKFSKSDYTIYGKPMLENPTSENPTQVNTKEVNTNKVNKKINKKTSLQRYQDIISWWNEKRKTRYKAGDNGLPNYQIWSKLYSDWEIKSAILIASKHPFWSDKMTPTILFRQKNPSGEPVDYIGQLLAYNSTDPTILRVKKAMQEMEEKENDTQN